MPVLGTKLRLPTPRRQLVARPRLVEQLRGEPGADASPGPGSAPAGFGKTTVLTQWLTSSVAEPAPRQVAWLSLDAGDADLRPFLTHLVAALQTTRPDLGVDALALLDFDRGIADRRRCWSVWSTTSTARRATVMALDDYHVIDSAAVHEAVTFLLDNLPRNGHPRHHQPRSTRRCRCPGCAPEASFSSSGPPTCGSLPTRPTTFLNQVMGLDLEPAQVAALEARTEGWAAGLQLAGLSARGPHRRPRGGQ